MLTIRELLSVYVPEDSTSNIDDRSLESSTPIFFVNNLIPYVVISDIVNQLVQFNTCAPTEIHNYKESSSDAQDDLVESSAPLNDTRCLISESRIEKVTIYEITDTNVAISKSLRLLPMVWYITPSIPSSNKFLDFSSGI